MKEFKDLTSEEIKYIATKEFDDSHNLVVCRNKSYIVQDIDDFLGNEKTNHRIVKIDSLKDLKKFFKENDFSIDKDTKKDLVEESKKIESPFYLAIRDNYDDYEFSIETSFDEALSFVDDEALYFVDDKNKIIEEYAEDYLNAGFMDNNSCYYHLGAKRYKRYVTQNNFDLEDLFDKYKDEILEMRKGV